MAEPGPAKRVLLVEDDADICTLLGRYLDARNFKIDARPDGEAAWEAFAANEFDLVLTDVMMPRLSGLDLIERIRSHPTRSRTPCIIVSAATPDERQVARLRVDGVLRKPIPLRELLSRMEDILRLAKGRRTGRFAAIQETAAAFGAPKSTPGGAAAPVFGQPRSSPGAAAAPPAFGQPRSAPGAPAAPPAFGQPKSAPGAGAAPAPVTPAAATRPGRAVPWATVPITEPPPFKGDASLVSLAAVLVTLFDQHVDGVLEIAVGQDVWTVKLLDGLVVSGGTTAPREGLAYQLVDEGLLGLDRAEGPRRVTETESFRVAEAIVQRDGVPASAVAGQLALHMRRAVCSALVQPGCFAVRAWRENPVLATCVLMDPLDLVVRTCLHHVSEEDAVRTLAALAGQRLFASEALGERLFLLQRHRPATQLVALVRDAPTVDTALARIRSRPAEASARELLALLLLQAVSVGQSAPRAGPARRAMVLGSMDGAWQQPGLAAQAARQREAVASVYLSTGSRDAWGTLGLPAGATETDLRTALGRWQQALGPPSLDDADLGPAKVHLAILRRRRDEAAALLLDPIRRPAYEAWLAQPSG